MNGGIGNILSRRTVTISGNSAFHPNRHNQHVSVKTSVFPKGNAHFPELRKLENYVLSEPISKKELERTTLQAPQSNFLWGMFYVEKGGHGARGVSYMKKNSVESIVDVRVTSGAAFKYRIPVEFDGRKALALFTKDSFYVLTSIGACATKIKRNAFAIEEPEAIMSGKGLEVSFKLGKDRAFYSLHPLLLDF